MSHNDCILRRLVSLLFVIGATACSDSLAPDATKGARMVIASEVTQTGTVATLVASNPTVRIVDAQGRPLSGLNVVFRSQTSTSKYSTSADGTASSAWQLGTQAGRQMLIAAVQGLSVPPDTFFAIAVADTAAALKPDGLTAQAGLAGAPAPSLPVIIVTDAFGNAKAGVHVTFEAGDGGSVAPSEATTDESGHAAVERWTLGPDFGENKLVVRALTLAPLTFTARVNVPLVAASVVAGARHSCALTANGDAYCWGADDQRQLGNDGNLNSSSTTPVRVTSVPRLVSLVSRGERTCGISDEAPPQAYCWGAWSMPFRIDAPTGLATVVLGDLHACGLDPSGQAFCWGEGSMGQLGNGDQVSSSAPVRVTGNVTFASLAAGATHTCGLTAAGQTFCWGLNDHAQLGSVARPNCFVYNYDDYYDVIPVECALGPQPVNTTLSFIAISAGYGTCGLTSGGDVSCAGFSDAMRPVSNGVRFARLTAGARCGLTSDGIAQCWAPIPGNDDTLAGTPIGDGNGLAFSSVSTGAQHQCGVLAGDGSVMCWGRNDSGQLGNGTKATSNTPLPVSRPINP